MKFVKHASFAAKRWQMLAHIMIQSDLIMPVLSVGMFAHLYPKLLHISCMIKEEGPSVAAMAEWSGSDDQQLSTPYL